MGMNQMPMANPQMGNMPAQMGAPMNPMNGMPMPVQGMAPMQGPGGAPMQPGMMGQQSGTYDPGN